MFDLVDDFLVGGDEVDGAEEIGIVFRLDAGVFAVGGEVDDLGNTLYFVKFGAFFRNFCFKAVMVALSTD